MFWRILTIGAVCTLFLQNAGCENMDKVSAFFTVESEPSVNNRVINAPLDQVSVTTQTTLSSLGYAAMVNKQGEEIRISAKNSIGGKLTVILTALKTKDGDQTRAHIEWEGKPDDQTGLIILANLQKSGK